MHVNWQSFSGMWMKNADARKLLAEMQRRYGNKIPELNGIETQINIEEELR